MVLALTFTPDDAYEAHKAGEPIMVDRNAARKIIRAHNAVWSEFLEDNGLGDYAELEIDAWDLLAWLGH